MPENVGFEQTAQLYELRLNGPTPTACARLAQSHQPQS